MSVADIDLPVWSFRPNWADSVVERLSFLTDIIKAALGAEQRRCVRPTPRRGIDADFLLTGPERAFFDLFMNRLGGSEVMVPLYWDIATLTEPLVAGDSERIPFDNTRREFTSGLVIVMGQTAFDYEVLPIYASDAGGIDLAANPARSWPKGTIVMPLRRMLIEEAGTPSFLAGSVSTVSVKFISNTANPWNVAADDSPIYAGLPVFLSEPNWRDGLEVTYDRSTTRLDGESGKIFQVDPRGQASISQSHSWFLNGRESLARFKDFVYRHRGRAGAFWLPTFKHDIRIVAPVSAIDTQITIANIGFGYTGGPGKGREYIAIKHTGGYLFRKIVSVEAGSSIATEVINLDAPTGLGLPMGHVLRVSFMDTGRLDQDDFEIAHYAGIDGLSEVVTTFRTFINSRTAPEPIYYPIPETTMGTTTCGVQSECYRVPIFEGWYLRTFVVFPGLAPFGIPAPSVNLRNDYMFQDGYTATIVPQTSIDWYWTNPITYDTAFDWLFSYQFGAGDYAGRQGYLYYQRWDEIDLSLAYPLPGSYGYTGGPGFRLGGRFPRGVFFNF